MRKARRGRGQERKVMTVWNGAEIRLERQCIRDCGHALGRHAVTTVLGTPKLNGNADLGEGSLREEDAQRIRNDQRLDAPVVDQGFALALTNAVAERAGLADAHSDVGTGARIGARHHERRVTSAREAEQTDAIRIDDSGVAPRAEQVVDEPLDVGRSFDKGGQIVGMAAVQCVVAGMRDGRDDESGVGERLSRIVMTQERAFPTVTDHDQRQLCIGDRAVLGRGDLEWTELDGRGCNCTRVPHGTRKGGRRTVRRHLQSLDACRQGGRHRNEPTRHHCGDCTESHGQIHGAPGAHVLSRARLELCAVARRRPRAADEMRARCDRMHSNRMTCTHRGGYPKTANRQGRFQPMADLDRGASGRTSSWPWPGRGNCR